MGGFGLLLLEFFGGTAEAPSLVAFFCADDLGPFEGHAPLAGEFCICEIFLFFDLAPLRILGLFPDGLVRVGLRTHLLTLFWKSLRVSSSLTCSTGSWGIKGTSSGPRTGLMTIDFNFVGPSDSRRGVVSTSLYLRSISVSSPTA